jgi:hypothetical protein
VSAARVEVRRGRLDALPLGTLANMNLAVEAMIYEYLRVK